MTDRLTLKTLLHALGTSEPKPGSIKLLRHVVRSDRTLLLKRGIKPAALSGLRLVDGDEKLTSLRLDRDLTEAYTAEQKGDVFSTRGRSAERLLVFAAEAGRRAEFLGVWRTRGSLTCEAYRKRYSKLLVPKETVSAGLGALPAEHLLRGLGLTGIRSKNYFYDLERDPTLLAGLEGRLVVTWGNPRNWIGASLDVEVAEIRPPGFVRPFPGYEHVDLSYRELCALLDAPHGNPEWKHRLDAVSGVYLIRDTLNAKLYVGSAYGDEGLWQRWTNYRKTGGHGNNVGLKAALDANADVVQHFRWSILDVLGRHVAKQSVSAAETRWKERLGARESGGYCLN